VIAYRHNDRRFAFLWEDDTQPAARWHGEGEGPAHYFADTPAGAWAEFLRHEEIDDPADLPGISRAMWAVEIGDAPTTRPRLSPEVQTSGVDSYASCQAEARRLRKRGSTGLVAQSAALQPGAASGWRVEQGLQPSEPVDGRVIILFGPRPDLVGWLITDDGHPPSNLLPGVRQFV
jgi:RES domain